MKTIVSFFFEAGQLKKVARSGWWLAGISNPESVAEHSFRTAVIGYVLAGMEHANADKCAVMCLFHDIQETRLTDFHKVTKRYIDTAAAKAQVLEDQLELLPAETADALASSLRNLESSESLEARIVHDADALECLIQALEYKAAGNHDVQEWIDTSYARLRTESAIELAKACLQEDGKVWWEKIKKHDDR
jgi:putative hydrolase of HD superfamily